MGFILLFFVVQFVHLKPAQELQMQKKIYKVSTVNVAMLQLLKHLFIPFWFVFNRTLPEKEASLSGAKGLQHFNQ